MRDLTKDLTTVEPDGVCVIDRKGENGRLATDQKVIHLAHVKLVESLTYRLSAGSWHETTIEAAGAHGLARFVECSLHNGVIGGEEMELDHVSWCSVDCVGLVEKAAFSHIDRLDGA